jgi:hypothetical protein
LTFIVYKKNINKKTSEISNDKNLKINLTRFNPFDELGGDQSFILSLLNQDNSGVIITSLHNRDITRIYAKAIKNGEGENSVLSKEEKLAILKTIKG